MIGFEGPGAVLSLGVQSFGFARLTGCERRLDFVGSKARGVEGIDVVGQRRKDCPGAEDALHKKQRPSNNVIL